MNDVSMRMVRVQSRLNSALCVEGYPGSEVGSQWRVECVKRTDASFSVSNDNCCRTLHRGAE